MRSTEADLTEVEKKVDRLDSTVETLRRAVEALNKAIAVHQETLEKMLKLMDEE
jgi:prefoldin subunit 5